MIQKKSNIHFARTALAVILLLLVVASKFAHGFLQQCFPIGSIKSASSTFIPAASTTARNMFTGIVEEVGTIVSLNEREDITLWDGRKGPGTELTVKGNVVLDGAYLGCSISVSGVCLTVTELPSSGELLKFGLAPETLRRTYFSTLRPGDAVNLERASEIGGRNSGHTVQGHVDGVGTILDKWTDKDSLWVKVEVPSNIIKYIVPKGFIAVDGTSLTVCEVDTKNSWFTFMLGEIFLSELSLYSHHVNTRSLRSTS